MRSLQSDTQDTFSSQGLCVETRISLCCVLLCSPELVWIVCVCVYVCVCTHRRVFVYLYHLTLTHCLLEAPQIRNTLPIYL